MRVYFPRNLARFRNSLALFNDACVLVRRSFGISFRIFLFTSIRISQRFECFALLAFGLLVYELRGSSGNAGRGAVLDWFQV